VRDLAPIVNVATGPFVLMANPAFAPNSVKELIALVQTQPGKVSYASSSAAASSILRWSTHPHHGGQHGHDPRALQGLRQGIADVLANQVPLYLRRDQASIQFTRSGKLKALGVTSPKRAQGAARCSRDRRNASRFRHPGLVRLYAPRARRARS